ncbi:transposase [Streptomyces cadmiisoli]|uniref:transposase n=1 Tax=Streptomyces cadmiisoli TaxID=2184053 RepID=UPI003CCC8B7B
MAAGDNANRLRSEASFAHMSGVAPIPASSRKTNRNRLNRGGNREANRALYMLVNFPQGRVVSVFAGHARGAVSCVMAA